MANTPIELSEEQAWSGSGDLYLPSNLGVRRGSGLNLQAEFKKAGPYTIQFGLTPPASQNPTMSAEAEILWSVKGNSVRRYINVYNGTTISGAGEGVYVRLKDTSENSLSNDPVRYTASINLIPGTRPNLAGSQPPILRPKLGTRDGVVFESLPAFLTGYQTITIPIPPNTGINSVLINVSQATNEALTQPPDITNGCASCQHVNSSSGAIFNLYNYDGFFKFMPIAPGATDILITNMSAGSTEVEFAVQPIFGVDG